MGTSVWHTMSFCKMSLVKDMCPELKLDPFSGNKQELKFRKIPDQGYKSFDVPWIGKMDFELPNI